LNGKLLLERFSFALIEGFVVDQIGCFVDQQFEDVFDLVVLLLYISGFASRGNRFVVILKVRSGLVLLMLAVHQRSVLGLRSATFLLIGTFRDVGVIQEVEDWVRWAFPWDRQLLEMDHFIAVHDLFDEFLGFLFIHRPDFTNTSFICLFETFILCLQLFEILGKCLVFFRQIDVILLMTTLFFREAFFDGTNE